MIYRTRAWVYILSNAINTVVHIGTTNDLERRILEHKSHSIPGFTQRYNVDKLVYIEEFQFMTEAIARERQLRGWARVRKNALIESLNPQWMDLAAYL